MVFPLVAVGCVVLVKSGLVMGQYSMKNYDPAPPSAYDRMQTLPGTDGKPVEKRLSSCSPLSDVGIIALDADEISPLFLSYGTPCCASCGWLLGVPAIGKLVLRCCMCPCSVRPLVLTLLRVRSKHSQEGEEIRG
eukprot:1780836-Rhodomonas_salina.4